MINFFLLLLRLALAPLLFLFFFLTPAVGNAASAPRVAVFFQPGFPLYGPGEMSSPRAIADALEKAGLRADLLDMDALADAKRFNAALYDALALPYGNTFPQAAFAAMRDFHKAGGCLILSGIPFTHPIVRETGERGREVWRDLGHNDDAARFGPEGMGVGAFSDFAPQPVWVAPRDCGGWRRSAKHGPDTRRLSTPEACRPETRFAPR